MNISKKPIFWLILILILIWSAVFSLPDKHLHLIFCNVGEGDATLISYRSIQILIDGGPDNKVIGCLSKNMPFWDRTIEVVILSHKQTDHFTGLVDVMQRYNVEHFIEELKRGGKVKIGPVEFSVLWPLTGPVAGSSRPTSSPSTSLGVLALDGTPSARATRQFDPNDTSMVLRLTFGNFCVLFTGDIPAKIDSQIEGLKNCQVLKVAHHGSKYATSEEFLEQVKPQLAVISVGKNRYGHPTEETLKRLKKIGAKILRTDQVGVVKVISDGRKWWVKN